MHAMLFGVVGLYGQECAGPDVQGHEMCRDSAFLEAAEQIVGEMETCGRRRDGAVLAGVDGLIIGQVPVVRRTPPRDVRRQREFAMTGDRFVERRPCEREA